MQLALSGHLFFVSQHLQGLLSEVPSALCIAFMQSDMSMPASVDIIVSCGSLGCAAAIADPMGASVSERAIKIAKIARSDFRVRSFKALPYHEDPYRNVKTRLSELPHAGRDALQHIESNKIFTETGVELNLSIAIVRSVSTTRSLQGLWL